MYRVTVSQTTLSSRSLTRRLATFDYVLLLSTVAVMLFGLAMVYSATRGVTSSDFGWDNFVVKQGIFAIGGFMIMLLISQMEYRLLDSFVWPMYIGSLVLLGIVEFTGAVAGGATRWINTPIFDIQPSEIAKFVLILTLAKYLSDRKKKMDRLSTFLGSGIIAGIPMVMIYLQPDLGTAAVCGVIWLGMIVAAQIRWVFLAGMGVLAIPGAFIAWNFVLATYMKDRLTIFMHPEADLYGQGYNILQARISIGAGGLFGKGFLGGTQSQLHFLKVQYADFIFAVVAEEFGLIGAVAMIALLYVIVIRYLLVAAHAPDSYGMLIAVGLAVWLGVHTFCNVAMNLSLLPVVGIPLPFISYGGSALISLFIGQGLIQSISLRSKKVVFD